MDAIIAICGQYKRPLAMAVAKEIAEEQRKGYRWYADRGLDESDGNRTAELIVRTNSAQ